MRIESFICSFFSSSLSFTPCGLNGRSFRISLFFVSLNFISCSLWQRRDSLLLLLCFLLVPFACLLSSGTTMLLLYCVERCALNIFDRFVFRKQLLCELCGRERRANERGNMSIVESCTIIRCTLFRTNTH